MAKNRNTFEKGRREVEKKRKAEEKRTDRRRKKDRPQDVPKTPFEDPRDELPTVE